MATGAVVRFRRIRLHHCRYLFAADGEKRGLSATHGAPLVVGRHGDHSRLLRLAVGGKTLGRPAMPDREPVDPERLRAAVSRQRLVVAVNTEQYWFGATFMGTTSLVMPLARQLSAPGNINLLGP